MPLHASPDDIAGSRRGWEPTMAAWARESTRTPHPTPQGGLECPTIPATLVRPLLAHRLWAHIRRRPGVWGCPPIHSGRVGGKKAAPGHSEATPPLLTRPSSNTYHRLTACRVAKGGSRLEDLDVPPDALSRPARRLRKALSLRLG